MKKIYVLLAIFIAGIVVYSTTVYIPAGYTAITRDDKSLYPEGAHLLQKYPFENTKLIKLSEQCEIYGRDFLMNDAALIATNIKVCWKMAKDINKIKRLFEVSYDYRTGSSDYSDYDQKSLIHSSVISNAIKVFSKVNTTNLINDQSINRRIMNETRRDLADTGIVITEISVSMPGFEPFEKAIKQRDEIKEQAEAEIKRIQEKAKELYS